MNEQNGTVAPVEPEEIEGDAGYGEEEEIVEAVQAGALPTYDDPGDDFESVGEDVEAYYEPVLSGAIYFTPHSVRLTDSKAGTPTKSSALIFGELTRPASLRVNAQEKEDRVMKEFPAGTAIGVWAKAGMRDLLKLGGAEVFMVLSGYRKIEGREKPMAKFKCKRGKSGGKGEKLALASDAREESIIEPAVEKRPPWWLEVLEDGGIEEANRVLEERAAAAKAAKERKGAKGKPVTPN